MLYAIAMGQVTKGEATVPARNVVVAKMDESFHELQQQQTAASDVN